MLKPIERNTYIFSTFRNVSDENIRFLTPEQALADTAHFINHIRRTEAGGQNSPIILVGGHYSASLAVWFRQRYPHLSTGKTRRNEFDTFRERNY